ncbi:uncharacterized protein Dana_GF27847, isoform B [Drosophila ananassae]|uniref:Uncharacterized protein, isoform B n=1 Tax=Drosophila ananassae TaxID=7217 RepID=A0A0P8XPF6_DROAN|nr:uncharacterized protein Dana_GF27847, isoform B [Drosophila ananassae]
MKRNTQMVWSCDWTRIPRIELLKSGANRKKLTYPSGFLNIRDTRCHLNCKYQTGSFKINSQLPSY